MQSSYNSAAGVHSTSWKTSTQSTHSNKQAAKYLVKFSKNIDLYSRKKAEIRRLKEELDRMKNYQQLLNCLLQAAAQDQKVAFDTRVIQKSRAEQEKLQAQLEQLLATRDENAKNLSSVKDFLHFLTRTLMTVLKDVNGQPPLLHKEMEKFVDQSIFTAESRALPSKHTGPTSKFTPRQNFSKTNQPSHKIKSAFKKVINANRVMKRKSTLPHIPNFDELDLNNLDTSDTVGLITRQSRFVSLPADIYELNRFELVQTEDPQFLLDDFERESELQDSLVDDDESVSDQAEEDLNSHRRRTKSLSEMRVDFQSMVNKGPSNEEGMWSQTLANYLACMTFNRNTRGGGKRMGILKTLLTIEDFKRIKAHRRSTLKTGPSKYDDLRKSHGKPGGANNEGNEDAESVGSEIDASLLEDIEEELVEKGIIKGESVRQINKDGTFHTVKLPKSFIPIKVSFKIGVDKQLDESCIKRRRDRIYRNFAIREMHWFVENDKIVGLRLFFLHLTERFFIEGQLHGKESERREVFSLKENEIFGTIRFVSDHSHLSHVRLVTNFGRQFKVGKKLKDLMAEGKSSVVRYFPKEIMLFKIFSVFDNVNQALAEIRFLYVRTVVY